MSLLVVPASFIASCGGGESGGGGTQTNPADFTISASPSKVSIGNGGTQTVVVSVTSENGFSASVDVSATGLPGGVTTTPAMFSLGVGTQQKVTLNASALAQPCSVTVSFKGTSGALSHNANVSLTVSATATAANAPFRSRYVRTNSFGEEFKSNVPIVVYDRANKRFFVSIPALNEIVVLDAKAEAEIGAIPVPSAWGLDISPVDGSLWAGTLVGDVYHVDPGAMTVMQRYPASTIGPTGFGTSATLVLSDGRLALQGEPEGIPGVDPWIGPVVWDPATNAMDTGTTPGVQSVCGTGSGPMALSGDRKKILMAGVDSGPQDICVYDATTKQLGAIRFQQDGFIGRIAPTPGTSQFFVTSSLNGVGAFDSQTMMMTGLIPGPANYIPNGTQLPAGANDAVISLDGKSLYLTDMLYGVIAAYDTSTLNLNGYIPSFRVNGAFGASGVVGTAVDETGLLMGRAGPNGVGFVDGSQPLSKLPSVASAGFLPTPSTGPESGGTQIQVKSDRGTLNPIPQVQEFIVGNAAASAVSQSLGAQNDLDVMATTPAASGNMAADVTLLYSDSSFDLFPEAFSYGPVIVQVMANAGPAAGGPTGTIFGYGFGSTTSGIQVTVGGATAKVLTVNAQPEGGQYPVPLSYLQFQMPSGAGGTAADVTVTTAAGSTTSAGAFHFVASSTYPITANLQAGIYDASRDLYYFTDRAQIQVLSASTGQWKSPIALPGTTTATEFLGIAESPDHTKVAVADSGGAAIFVADPDNPAAAQRFAMPSQSGNPAGLAIANNGVVYFVTPKNASSFHKLDTGSGTITDLGTLASSAPTDVTARVVLSPDGTTAYSCVDEGCVAIDAGTGAAATILGSVASNVFPDVSISGDGSTFDFEGELFDSNLNSETVPGYIDWQLLLPTGRPGQKVNQDGSILYQPLTDGMDLLTRNSGQLLYRLQTPQPVPAVYDPITIGPRSTVAVISSGAVTVMDLSSLPTPPSDLSAFPLGVGAGKNGGTREMIGIRELRQGERPGAPPMILNARHSPSPQ